MTTPIQDPPEVLSGEILAEAGRQRDEILARAQRESEALLTAATAEADKIRQEQLAAARTEAARRSELIFATLPVETGRLRSARIEALLENIREATLQGLQTRNVDGHQTVAALAAEAIRRMPGTDFILKVSAADQVAFGGTLVEEVSRRADRSPLTITVSADPAVADGGVIIRDAAGTRIWDNRLTPRLERLWPELRRQIARQTSLIENNELAGGSYE